MKKIVLLIAIVGFAAAADAQNNPVARCIQNATGKNVSSCVTKNSINEFCVVTTNGVAKSVFDECNR